MYFPGLELFAKIFARLTCVAIYTLLCLEQVLMRQRELGLAQIAGTSDMAIDGQPPMSSSGLVPGNLFSPPPPPPPPPITYPSRAALVSSGFFIDSSSATCCLAGCYANFVSPLWKA